MTEAQENRLGVSDEELRLWQEKNTDDGGTARAMLIERYLPLARQIAAKLYRNRPDDEIPFEDYHQYGNVGLLEAVNRYDETQGASFATFATHRIRGAILNGLDTHTERRRRAAFVRRNRRQLVESLEQTRSDTEGGAFRDVVDLTIMLAIGFMIEDTGVGSVAESKNMPLQCQALVELKQAVQKAVEALPAREQIIIRYHYFHHVGFIELANLLQLSKGRVSQIHKVALQRIRATLGEETSLEDYY